MAEKEKNNKEKKRKSKQILRTHIRCKKEAK